MCAKVVYFRLYFYFGEFFSIYDEIFPVCLWELYTILTKQGFQYFSDFYPDGLGGENGTYLPCTVAVGAEIIECCR